MSVTDVEALSPELALVDPGLAQAERQITERKAAMSATEPSNGTFFVDQAQPAPEPGPLTPPEPAPLAPPPAEPALQQAAAPPQPAPDLYGSQPMLDVPLGTLIFRAGLLAEEQLEDALQEGMRTGKRLGEVLLERGLLHERDLGRMLAGQKGLPFVEISASDADPAALRMLPVEKARMQMALPLRYEGGNLVVAVADPSNELVLENLRRTIGSEPVLEVAAHGDLMRAIEEAYAALEAPAAEPQLQEPQPAPAPVQPEPLESLSPPAVTPLPTVLPPPEERAAHAEAPPPLQPQPPVQPVEQPPPAVAVPPPASPVETEPPPLLPPPAAETQQPAAVEQPAPEPVIAPLQPPVEPAPVDPAAFEPAPVEPAPLEPAPVEPAAVEPVSEAVAPVVEAVPEPEPPVAPAPPVEQPPLQPESPPAPEPLTPAAVAPPEPPPAPEPPAPAAVSEPELPAAPQPMPAAPAPEPASLHIVYLRLRDGEALEVGTFVTQPEAAAHAQEVVRQIAGAEAGGSWPYFSERYLRPDTIVSVELTEQRADKWMGSAARAARWATQT